MTTDDTRIIFIHGLAAKPAEERLHELWRKTLLAGVRCDRPALAATMEADGELFRSAYWANAVPDHLEEPTVYVHRLSRAVDATIATRKKSGIDLHISRSGWAKAKVRKFGLSVVDALATALTIKDEVIDKHMREVRLYRGDQYIADRIREPLERELREAWSAGKRVIVIGHSMGTFIAYDVLWRFSHRSEKVYRAFRSRKIDLLVTMGSPLGDRALRDFMLIERWESATKAKTRTERRRFYPTNIERWHNYSAYGDIVSHDGTLEDDFFRGMRKDVGDYGKHDLMDYTRLYNPYLNTKGKQNPHKSYGYLVQPKLSQNLRRFFGVP